MSDKKRAQSNADDQDNSTTPEEEQFSAGEDSYLPHGQAALPDNQIPSDSADVTTVVPPPSGTSTGGSTQQDEAVAGPSRSSGGFMSIFQGTFKKKSPSKERTCKSMKRKSPKHKKANQSPVRSSPKHKKANQSPVRSSPKHKKGNRSPVQSSPKELTVIGKMTAGAKEFGKTMKIFRKRSSDEEFLVELGSEATKPYIKKDDGYPKLEELDWTCRSTIKIEPETNITETYTLGETDSCLSVESIPVDESLTKQVKPDTMEKFDFRQDKPDSPMEESVSKREKPDSPMEESVSKQVKPDTMEKFDFRQEKPDSPMEESVSKQEKPDSPMEESVSKQEKPESPMEQA